MQNLRNVPWFFEYMNMRKNHERGVVLISRNGCLLPLLIIFNLFFGRLFLRPIPWLLLGVALVILLMIQNYITTRKVVANQRKHSRVIDIEGEVVDKKPKLKEHA